MSETTTTGGIVLPTLHLTGTPDALILPRGLTDDLLDGIVLAVLDNVDRESGLIDVSALRRDVLAAFADSAR